MKHQSAPDELLSHLVDAEWDDRPGRKLERLLKAARFPFHASFEEIDRQDLFVLDDLGLESFDAPGCLWY